MTGQTPFLLIVMAVYAPSIHFTEWLYGIRADRGGNGLTRFLFGRPVRWIVTAVGAALIYLKK